jgi:hypothetical protein
MSDKMSISTTSSEKSNGSNQDMDKKEINLKHKTKLQSKLIKISINKIEKPYEDYPKEFYDWCKINNITKFPNIKKNKLSAGAQGLALLLHNKNQYVKRDDLNEFFNKLEIDTRDSIQSVNKTEQWGLKRGESSKKYWIPHPYQLGIKHLLRTKIEDYADKDSLVNAIKLNIKNDYLDIPNDKWQLGHKNPDEPNTDDKENIVLQPPIQQKYRDKYIFIDSMTKIPTPKYLIKNNFRPYNEKQQMELYMALKKKFEVSGDSDTQQTESPLPVKKKLSKKEKSIDIEV